MSSVSIAAIAMRRSIRRCSVPGLYSVKSWAVLVRRRSMNLGQPIPVAVRRTRTVSACASTADPPIVFDERVGNFGHRKHKVDRARHDRAARHAVIAGLIGVLRDDEPAFFLHGFQPKAAIGPGSRKDHADGARTALLGQRVQQEVEGRRAP